MRRRIGRRPESRMASRKGQKEAPSQTAALAAGNQKKAWNYIELFYHEQGDETSSYVTDSYLSGLAAQIPGLNVSQWGSDRQSSTLSAKVTADEQAAAAAGYNSTP